MNQLKFSWIINKSESGQLLRTFLRDHKRISKKALADVKFAGGMISVNGEEVTVRYTIKEGDRVEVIFPKELISEGITPVNLPLSIVFEDDYLMVINKPPNLATIPSRDHRNSLASGVIYYLQNKRIPSTFHAINRLDRDTSGLLMVAKYRYIHDLFVHANVDKPIQRKYMALVHGIVSEDRGTLDAPIGRKMDSIIEREVTEKGQHAVTHFEVVNRYLSTNASLVKVELETGRTHQIRVHFSHLGHPLIGDSLYGGKKEGLSRQGLHSYNLVFTHPITGENHSFTIPLPEDMTELINRI